jgi:hypothetical protein
MRYIGFAEFNPEDIDKAAAVANAYYKELAKNPDMYPKVVSSARAIGIF